MPQNSFFLTLNWSITILILKYYLIQNITSLKFYLNQNITILILKYYTNFIQTQKTDEFNGSVIDFDTETNLVPFGEECECDYDEILALIAPVLRSKPMQSPRSPKTRKFEETIKDLNEIIQKNEKKIEELAQILREKNNEIKKLANNLSYKPQVKESPR